jgi:outer membrane protein
MKNNLLVFPALVLGLASVAPAQTGTSTKVAIIHIQNAVIGTKDGQKAANELQGRFAPKKAELEKKQVDIQQQQEQLRKGSATMSDQAKQDTMRRIDQDTKSLNRAVEDFQAEVDQAQGKTFQEVGQKVMTVVYKYAKDNGYSLVLDVSNPQTPVLYAADGIDITNDIVALYDKHSSPAMPAGAPAAAPPKPPATTSAPPPAAVPPAAGGAVRAAPKK